MIVLLALFATAIHAHNWVGSAARARGVASTVLPTQSKRGNKPHVQVGRTAQGTSQPFIVEWATGHGATAYLSILKASDEDKLSQITPDLLHDYIANAPTGATTPPNAPFHKLHRKVATPLATTNTHKDASPSAGFYKEARLPSHAEYRAATPAVARRLGDDVVTEVVAYHDAQMADDRRVAYDSDKYPWLLAVHKYSLVAKHPGEYDFTNIELPGAGSTPENYIVYWYWRAYRDTVDVEYTAGPPVANPYGTLSEAVSFERIDHCWFPDHRQLMGKCHQVVTDIDECMYDCRDGRYCDGILLTPIRQPDMISDRFKTNSDVWGVLETKDLSGKLFDTPRVMCDRSEFVNVKDNEALACVALRHRKASDVYDVYEIVKDPTHPAYYSTCLVKELVVTFDNEPPPIVRKPTYRSWLTPGSCLSCERAARNSWLSVRPMWLQESTCINCDIDYDYDQIKEPDQGFDPNETYPWTPVDGFCDGIRFTGCQNGKTGHCEVYADSANEDTCPETGDELSCFKAVAPINARASLVNLKECYVAAMQDPECTGLVSRSGKGGCYCFRADRSCCKPCDVKTNVRYFGSSYQLQKN